MSDLPRCKPEFPKRLDIDFSVPFTHRLRFTSDCLGSDWPILAELFESSPHSKSRVQVWIDDGLVQHDKLLSERVESLFASADNSFQLSSEIQYVPGGETVKNDVRFVQGILEAIHRDNLDRRSYILVVGGGAVLDAVGYAAAIAHRGIRLIRVPTTTLAQADSGVGVKNAINAFGKKNWQGTFAVPWGVVNDQRLLEGLSDRDFRCGFSEAVKVSLLKSPTAFQDLVRTADQIAAREMPAAMQAIRNSVLMHIRHISEGGDPFEALEARPLDFGHWSAHKLEALTNYELRHGEAVAIGIALDTVYSSLVLGLDESIMLQTLSTLTRLKLPIYHPNLRNPEIFAGLEEFRQHLGGRLTLTMLSAVGNPIDVHDIDRKEMLKAIDYTEAASLAANGVASQVNSGSLLPK